MCDTGFFIIGFIVTSLCFVAFMLLFYSFEYNCNDFTADDMVRRTIIFTFDHVDGIQVSAKCTLPSMEKENVINQILRKDE